VTLGLLYIFDVKYLPFLSQDIKAKYPPHVSLTERIKTQLESNWRETVGGFNFQADSWPEEKIYSKLRLQLNESFPYNPNEPMPKCIWQTWKTRLDSPDFPQDDKVYIETWQAKNPDFVHKLITDDEMQQIVETSFANAPQVIKAFNLMPKPVLKADFFRYLIVFIKGGIYSDIDTVNLKPIASWVSSQNEIYNQTNNPGLVVGIEADPDFKGWSKYYARRLQFVQWTLQGKAGHPVLRELIARITELTIYRAENELMDEVLGKDAGDDIMNWTGPGIWTDTIFKYLNELFQSEEYFLHPTWDNYHAYLDWRTFTHLQSPVVVRDVVILPITSFSPGILRMGAGSVDHALAYVEHQFKGSWKNGKINQ
jgi:alpha 1,6-mannosyltransferase